MKIGGSGTFVRFGEDKQDKIKLPKEVEKKLTEIAKKFGADVEKAKKIYQSLKGLKHIKLTDEQIFKTIEHDLDPNSPKITTAAMGEEGGGIRPPHRYTTLAMGEEGGRMPGKPPSSPPMTTMALGEEGGDPPPATTAAVGEEGGDPSNPPITTMALGEEGGDPPPATTAALGEEGGDPGKFPITTMALGEEGGRGLRPKLPPKDSPNEKGE